MAESLGRYVPGKWLSLRVTVKYDTTFTSVRIVDAEVPVSGLARVTDATGHPLLALTQLTVGVGSTAAEWVARHLLSTGRITTAL